MTKRLGGGLIVAAAGAVLAFAAATVPQIYTSYALPGDAGRTTGTIVIDPELRLYRDPVTGLAHLGINPAVLGMTVRTPSSDGSASVVIGKRSIVDIIPGANTIAALSDTGSSISLQISAPVSMADPPAAPGACPSSAGVFAADSAFFYFCVPTPANDGYVWARVQAQTTW